MLPLQAAGAPEDDAIAAAEELAAYENRFTNIENRLGSVETRLANIENRLDHLDNRLDPLEKGVGVVETNVATLAGKITVLTWAVGINAAATIAILGVLLRGRRLGTAGSGRLPGQEPDVRRLHRLARPGRRL
jgi:tetrahydromethanopterin S-methyltransferase subunit G